MHALIIIDVQEAFDIPPDIIAKIRGRMNDFPLRIFTQFINSPETLFHKKMDRQGCAPGDPSVRLRIHPRPNDIVLEKCGYGLRAEQIQTIKNRGVKEVTVSGADTDACVLAVMFTLWDSGIDCHIEPELCWSSTGLHDQALQIAREQFGV